MTDSNLLARLAADCADLAARCAELEGERDALLDELERIKGSKRDSQAKWRAKRVRPGESPVDSPESFVESPPQETAAGESHVDSTSLECRISSRGFLNPTILPSTPSKENLPKKSPSPVDLSPWSGTELAGAPFNARTSMDLTTIAQGHPATPLEPPPTDWSITAEADELTRSVLVAAQANLSIDLVRRVKREVSKLLRTTSDQQVTQGLRNWYDGDDNLHPGNIKYWVAKAGRQTPPSRKGARLQTLLDKKTGTGQKGICS
jgi:hypothetical protein